MKVKRPPERLQIDECRSRSVRDGAGRVICSEAAANRHSARYCVEDLVLKHPMLDELFDVDSSALTRRRRPEA